MERYLEYWQESHLLEKLHAINPSLVQNNSIAINTCDCDEGKISNDKLKQEYANKLLLVIPKYYQSDDNIFFPYAFLIQLREDGVFQTTSKIKIPLFSKSVLEPSMPNPIVLGLAEDIATFITANPLEDDANWQMQLSYAEAITDQVCPECINLLTEEGYSQGDNSLLCSVADIIENTHLSINSSFIQNKDNITIVNASQKSDIQNYARKQIVDDWIHAAIKELEPPRHVVARPGKDVKFATIFDYIQPANTIDSDARIKLLEKFDLYLYGKQLLFNWHEIKTRINDKYLDKGGIDSRVAQLQLNLKEAHNQYRHLETLHTILLRQQELISSWSRVFDFIPVMQKNRLARLYKFFAENFPEEDVSGYTQEHFNQSLQQKKNRAENAIRMIADCLHQVENDQQQLNLVQEKSIEWVKMQGVENADDSCVESHLDNIWQDVTANAAAVWQHEFANKQQYQNFINIEPSDIDRLYVEYAQYVSTTDGLKLLADCKHAYILGCYDYILSEHYPTYIDYELTKYHGLVCDELDFEDLQYDGVLGSTGNLWCFITKEREANSTLEEVDTKKTYEIIHNSTSSQKYLGSRTNIISAAILLKWLQENQDIQDVAIYTCFGAQKKILQQQMLENEIDKVPVYLIQEPVVSNHKIILFLPVYGASDKGPYIFDKGIAMFEQLKANALEKIIVIGDNKLFNPKLHSASGNFAKLLSNYVVDKSEINNNIEAFCE